MSKYVYSESSKVLTTTPLITDKELVRICEEAEDATKDQITSFITTAHLLLQEDLDGYGVSLPRLKQIELYLAAHFAGITFPIAAFESAGKVQVSYQKKTDMGLRFTKYGQMALTLDPTGKLDPATKGKSYSISWMGMTRSEYEGVAT